MDHARKIGKPKNPTVSARIISPPCSVTDKPLIKDEEVTEDRRLANWRKWLDDRKKHYKYYSKKTDRDKQDLLITKSDRFRQKVEMREFMEITVGSANKKKPDTYRGNPGFWDTPESLSKHGNPDLPDIPITLTKKQLNVMPEVERITLPELTQKEKGFLSQSEQTTLMWQCSGNSNKLRNKLSREMKSFEAEKSGLRKLAVEGRKLGQRKSKFTRVPVITITEPDSFEYENAHNQNEEDAVVLKIQDREIKLIKGMGKTGIDEKSLDDFTWSLIFKSSGSSIIERTIRLENRGTFTINYRWRYGSTGSTLISRTSQCSPFFFNKNNNLILPGQITVLRIWFRSRVSCSATEFWTLVTDPKLCQAPLVFRFWGCCSPSPKTLNVGNSDVGLDSESIDRYLDRRIRNTKIQEIIQEILNNVHEKRRPLPAYGSLFVESEIFQAKNPSFFYNLAVVQQLRDIYNNATSHDSPPWSLSLDDLRGILVQLKKPDIRNEALLRFNESCRKCLEPSLYTPIGNIKRSMVHNMLCSFVNHFEAEKEYVRAECYQGSNAVKMTSEAQGDTSGSTSVSRTPQSSLTPRRKTKRISRLSSRPKTSSKTSIIATNRDSLIQTTEKGLERDYFLYKEVFHVRIRAMLMDTIDGICGVVDTVNNLKAPEK